MRGLGARGRSGGLEEAEGAVAYLRGGRQSPSAAKIAGLDLRDAGTAGSAAGMSLSSGWPRVTLSGEACCHICQAQGNAGGWVVALEYVIDLRNNRGCDAGGHDRSLAWDRLDGGRIAFITCVNDERQYDICRRYIDSLEVPKGFRAERWMVLGARSMAEGYQQAMQQSSARYKVYLHQDVYLVNPGLLGELLRLFQIYPRLGLVGVVGCTRIPLNGIWFVNNPLHIYGCLWEYRRPGGPSALLGPLNRKRMHFMRFRSFVGDYLPAVAVDGLFMATQYDVPWVNPLGGFELYDQVQSLNFLRDGLEVGIARQERAWCLHWGPLEESSPEQGRRRQERLHEKAAAFRRLYAPYLGLSAAELYRRYRTDRGTQLGVRCSTAKAGATDGTWIRDGSLTRLGVVIVTFNGRDMLLRSLQALFGELDHLDGVRSDVVVVDNASTDGTADAVLQQFPSVRILRNPVNCGPAAGFNAGLRQLDEQDVVLVMNNDVEIARGSLVRMMGYLTTHPQLAGVVAALFNPDGTPQFQRLKTMELWPRKPKRPARVTFAGTTCALIRWNVLVDVGLYDERFYFFNEDLDWSLRAMRKGHIFHFLPEARVTHYGSVGLNQNRAAIYRELYASNLWYLYKHAGPRWMRLGYWGQHLHLAWLGWKARQHPERLVYLAEARRQLDSLYRRLKGGSAKPELAEWAWNPGLRQITG